MKDTLYQHGDEVVDFAFDEKVVSVFPDMIKRSVPGYPTIIKITGMLAARYVQPGTRCYDLGCSLGASTFAMRHHIEHDDVAIVAVDNSPAMIEGLEYAMAEDTASVPVIPLTGDVAVTAVENASMVVLNFTLQFLPPDQRAAVIRRIYQGLVPGGILVLSEKLRFEDSHLDELYVELHHEFKKAQGYSDMEIAGKRTALENVLIPETLGTHRRRMRQAGFESVDVWFQCLNFASLVAVKGRE
ncbi:MAG: carboxy-S-adenosyl-L-methionine synthase CmoA [Pseudomonadota bacterium]